MQIFNEPRFKRSFQNSFGIGWPCRTLEILGDALRIQCESTDVKTTSVTLLPYLIDIFNECSTYLEIFRTPV